MSSAISDRLMTMFGPAYKCRFCGQNDVRPRGKRGPITRYCSDECRRAFDRASVIQKRSEARAVKTCRQCGSEFSAEKTDNQKYCSTTCRLSVYQEKARISWRAKARHLDGARSCKECGRAFHPRQTDGPGTRKTYCSQDCSDRYRKRIDDMKRRAVKRAARVEAVDPFKVFERDRWKCQLCGVRTLRRLRGSSDDRAPELDHIVPLAKSGDHSYRNTQCACRACNRAKLAKPLGQLRMFG